MYLINFCKDVLLTMTDVKDKSSLMIFNKKCSLNCYKCHSIKTIKDKSNIVSEDFIIEQIELNSPLIQVIILSGGNFLDESIEDIFEFINKIKRFNKDIVINTNGMYSEKLAKLIETGMIQGAYMDIKYPIWLETNEEVFTKVYGVKYSIDLAKEIMKSMVTINESNLKYKNFRTVKYDFLPQSYFDAIQEELKNYCVDYQINPFHNLDDDE